MNRLSAVIVLAYFTVLTTCAGCCAYRGWDGDDEAGVACACLVAAIIGSAIWIGVRRGGNLPLVIGLASPPVLSLVGFGIGASSRGEEGIGALAGLVAGVCVLFLVVVTRYLAYVAPSPGPGFDIRPKTWKVVGSGIIVGMIAATALGGSRAWVKPTPPIRRAAVSPTFVDFMNAVRRNEVCQRIDELDRVMEASNWDPALLRTLLPERRKLLGELQSLAPDAAATSSTEIAVAELRMVESTVDALDELRSMIDEKEVLVRQSEDGDRSCQERWQSGKNAISHGDLVDKQLDKIQELLGDALEQVPQGDFRSLDRELKQAMDRIVQLEARLYRSLDAIVLERIVGTWTGEVRQPGHSPYSVKMTIHRDGSGTIEYPELDCGGDIRRLKSRGVSFVYRETITKRRATSNGDGCIDTELTIRLNDDETLTWTSTGSWQGQSTTCTATLTKVPS